jgi:DNA-binding PadR family transcriptional regulator
MGLSEPPSHGYALHKEVGVATSTIYAHLDDLEEAGMVKSYEVEDDSRNKTEHRITEDGEKLLELLG